MARDLLSFIDEYRLGRSRIAAAFQAFSTRAARSQAEFSEVLRGSLPADEFVKLWALAARLGQLLRLTHAGELSAARTAVAEIRGELAADEGTVVFRLLCRSQAAAAEAYVDYRESRWERARSHLRESFQADESLVVEHGLASQNAHQLQLACNAVRSVAVRGRCGHALRLAVQLLDHLQGRSDRLPVPVAVRRPPHRLQAMPPEQIEGIAAQVVGEVARALSAVPDSRRRGRLLRLLASSRRQGLSAAWDRIADWISIQLAALRSPAGQFLRLASEFVAEGPDALFVPWASVIVEACRACRRLGTPAAREFVEEVEGDLAGWTWVPDQLKERAAGQGSVALAGGASWDRPKGGQSCRE